MWGVWCRVIRIWRNVELVITKKKEDRYLKYCLNVLNLACLCGLLYVFFQYRSEHLEISLQRTSGP